MAGVKGKTVVVTGASAGIGAAAARRFAQLGATVAVVGRDPRKTSSVADDIGATAHTADLERLDDVRALAGELLGRYPRIDVLANNAGAYYAKRTLTTDGHEATFQVNYLAPYLLTTLLLDRLAEAPDARVITTTSALYRRGNLDLDDLTFAKGRYRGVDAYGTAKLAVLLFTQELAHRTADSSITAACFHPGTVASEMYRFSKLLSALITSPLGRRFSITPDQGAEPLLFLAITPDTDTINGAYYDLLNPESPRHPQTKDPDLAQRLWEHSATLVGTSTR